MHEAICVICLPMTEDGSFLPFEAEGREIRRRIEEPNALLHAYRTGLIKEG